MVAHEPGHKITIRNVWINISKRLTLKSRILKWFLMTLCCFEAITISHIALWPDSSSSSLHSCVFDLMVCVWIQFACTLRPFLCPLSHIVSSAIIHNIDWTRFNLFKTMSLYMHFDWIQYNAIESDCVWECTSLYATNIANHSQSLCTKIISSKFTDFITLRNRTATI